MYSLIQRLAPVCLEHRLYSLPAFLAFLLLGCLAHRGLAVAVGVQPEVETEDTGAGSAKNRATYPFGPILCGIAA